MLSQNTDYFCPKLLSNLQNEFGLVSDTSIPAGVKQLKKLWNEVFKVLKIQRVSQKYVRKPL